jgi:hypothetical protein
MSAERPRRANVVLTCAFALGVAGALALLPSGASGAASPSVQTMVVGRGDTILAGPRLVNASTTTLAVAGRRCAIAAATPLSALAGLARLGGPTFSLRDFGHCGSSPRNSSELFVDRLAGEANSGQSGWEYKVGGLAGSTGAADTSGVLGNGRLLRPGQQVLWFWCQASAGGCQRTLAVSAAANVAAAGSLKVRVTGYENEGRGAPVSGAVVRLGTDFATTGSSGQASLIVPSAAGRYTLSATRSGLVPAFPETIVVR